MIQSSQSAFIIDPGNSRTIDYTFAVPEGVELLGFRAQASTLQHSDSEQQILPVLPAKVLVTDSKPFYIPGGEQTVPVVMPAWKGNCNRPRSRACA